MNEKPGLEPGFFLLDERAGGTGDVLSGFYPAQRQRQPPGHSRCCRDHHDPHLRDLAAHSARGLQFRCPPLEQEGAGKTGCLPHPRSRVPMHMAKAHTSIQVRREHPGLPCAMALRLTSCSSRRTALLPPSPARLIASLAPAPRRPNHTTSPYASGACVSRATCVHRIPPRVRDVRNAPLIG